MKDETEGLKMEPDESVGKLYTVGDLKALPERGATELGETKNGYRIKVSNADMDIGRLFRVSILGPTVADLEMEVELDVVKGVGCAKRTFTYRPSESLPAEPPKSLILKSDASGNPTAYLEDKLLDVPGIIAAIINPVRVAVGDLPDS